MFLVRPAQPADIAALVSLAEFAPSAVHTLPRTREAIGRALDLSLASFAAQVTVPGSEAYFLVLENTGDGSIAGAATIRATAGAGGSYFTFRNDVFQQVSRDLGISHRVPALTLCSDLSEHSQLAGFHVSDSVCAGAQPALLSRARLLFAAMAPQRFGERFFAALAGVTDQAGASPFWDALGRKFFGMDFIDAERTIGGARNRALIVEMMPHYPVYVPLLPVAAQAAMGQPHGESALALRMLKEEGFSTGEFVDIFDGGPVLQAHKNALKSFAASMPRVAATDRRGGPVTYLVGAVGEQRFRAVLADCAPVELSERVGLSPAAMRALGVAAGDAVTCVRL